MTDKTCIQESCKWNWNLFLDIFGFAALTDSQQRACEEKGMTKWCSNTELRFQFHFLIQFMCDWPARQRLSYLPHRLQLLRDGNSWALRTCVNYCCGATSDGYDYTGAAHVLGISADDGVIELHVGWKHECPITAVGRALFLCPIS